MRMLTMAVVLCVASPALAVLPPKLSDPSWDSLEVDPPRVSDVFKLLAEMPERFPVEADTPIGKARGRVCGMVGALLIADDIILQEFVPETFAHGVRRITFHGKRGGALVGTRIEEGRLNTDPALTPTEMERRKREIDEEMKANQSAFVEAFRNDIEILIDCIENNK